MVDRTSRRLLNRVAAGLGSAVPGDNAETEVYGGTTRLDLRP
jgi:hypothetical protein